MLEIANIRVRKAKLLEKTGKPQEKQPATINRACHHCRRVCCSRICLFRCFMWKIFTVTANDDNNMVWNLHYHKSFLLDHWKWRYKCGNTENRHKCDDTPINVFQPSELHNVGDSQNAH